MSQAVITKTFVEWKAKQAADNQPVVLDEFIFANIPGLDPSVPVSDTEGMPAAGLIVDRKAVSKTGVINAHSVVYSVTLGADVGDYEFNWIGLANKATGTLAMIIHAPTQRKVKNANGQQGNVLVRSMLMEYSGAQTSTNITTPAETWQIDFTARLAGMDERHRIENMDLYGEAAFFDNGYLVAKSGAQFYVTKGAGYVAGLRSELVANQNITVAAKPTKVWLDVCWKGTLTSVWAIESKLTVAADLANYMEGGTQHYVFALASISADGSITDLRPKGSLGDQQASNDYLRKDKNLADVKNAADARKNLELKGAALLDAGSAAGQVPVNDANGDLLVPSTNKIGVKADENNEVVLINSRQWLGTETSYPAGGMVGATRYNWYENYIDTGPCRGDSKSIQSYAVSFNGEKKFTVTPAGVNVLSDTPAYNLCTTGGQKVASLGYADGVTLNAGTHGAWKFNNNGILAPAPVGEANGGLRVSPQGGDWGSWRQRSSGLQIDMIAKNSAFNIFKATQWGSIHACAMNVVVDDSNRAVVALNVGNATFHFSELNGMFNVPNVQVGGNIAIGDNDSGFVPYSDGAVGFWANGTINGYFNSAMIYHNNIIRAEKIMSGTATLQNNGNIYGDAWGGWLSDWLNSKMVTGIRLSAASDYQERSLNERQAGGVMTSFADRGSSNYWIRVRSFQYQVGPTWYTAVYS